MVHDARVGDADEQRDGDGRRSDLSIPWRSLKKRTLFDRLFSSSVSFEKMIHVLVLEPERAMTSHPFYVLFDDSGEIGEDNVESDE